MTSPDLVGAGLILLAATLYSAVGHGGASGYLAVMVLIGTAPTEMRPAALVLNVFVASIATMQFARAGHFRWALFLPFAVTSIPAAYLGGRIELPGTTYRVLVGVVLVLSAGRFLLSLRAEDTARRSPPLPIALAAGAALGFLAGLTGVGGGIFLSPLLILTGWATIRATAATSAAFILVNSVAGLAGQASQLSDLPEPIGWWIVAAVAGGMIGARLGSGILSSPALRRSLALVLVLAGTKLILE
ncbi:MAG: sulfite exporter TauE/SafE family protein [Gemmatimonadales bacterium]|nr:sulfite exporter TauE/SafE family protein [Gemmatimonadales bacterium]